MLRLLVTGANGQLGSALRKLTASGRNLDTIFTDLPELDITQAKPAEDYIHKANPSHIINCASFTAVDQAESQQENAYLINAEAVRNLSEITAKAGIKLIHISTDYVFDGMHYKPYTETDVPNPKTIYGLSKWKGEEYLRNKNNSIIIRTSWLYSEMEQSFIRKILNKASSGKEIKVIYDQIGTPCCATDLAGAILDIILKTGNDKMEFIPGIYHYSNEGVASWYDFAEEIIKNANISCKVIPIESDEFPVKTKRPHYSVLSKNKIKSTYQIQIPYWKDSLQTFMNKMNQ